MQLNWQKGAPVSEFGLQLGAIAAASSKLRVAVPAALAVKFLSTERLSVERR